MDREEWAKFMATVRKYVFFWKGTPRPAEAEESLATLLARRDQVRGERTAAGAEARPELFQPAQTTAPAFAAAETAGQPAERAPGEGTPAPAPPAEEKPAGTTSRLLEAKRRAQQRRGGNE
jgi:hypothetical protein